jgi:hypothetical protein
VARREWRTEIGERRLGRSSDAGKLEDGGEEFSRVGVLRLVEDFFGGTRFDDLADVHDGDEQCAHAVMIDRKSETRNTKLAMISNLVARR